MVRASRPSVVTDRFFGGDGQVGVDPPLPALPVASLPPHPPFRIPIPATIRVPAEIEDLLLLLPLPEANAVGIPPESYPELN